MLQEALDSGSQPRYTNTNGQARDTLRTSQNRADAQKRVTVTATVPAWRSNPRRPSSSTDADWGLLLALAGVAVDARAEIAVLANGQTMKISAHRPKATSSS